MSTDIATIRQKIQQLAAIEPGAEPFVSVYLDMSTGSAGTHPSLTFLRGALVRQERALGPRGAALESFQADSERLQQFVTEELGRDSQGVAIFACHARGIFEAMPLAVAPENALTVAQSPRLYQLSRLLDEYTPYCVALLSRVNARVFTAALGDITTAAELHQSDRHTRKTQVGGWSKGYYQKHVELSIAEFAEEVAKAVADTCASQGISRLLVGGEVVALGALERALPAALGQHAVSIEHMDAELPDHKVLMATLPLVAAAQAASEEGTVSELLSLASHGELAVVGAEPTMYALQTGAVDKLVMADGFSAEGWRCTSCFTYGSGGMPTACPSCKSPVVVVELKESLAGNAARLNIPTEYVRAGTALDAEEGVGAFLRYPLP